MKYGIVGELSSMNTSIRSSKMFVLSYSFLSYFSNGVWGSNGKGVPFFPFFFFFFLSFVYLREEMTRVAAKARPAMAVTPSATPACQRPLPPPVPKIQAPPPLPPAAGLRKLPIPCSTQPQSHIESPAARIRFQPSQATASDGPNHQP